MRYNVLKRNTEDKRMKCIHCNTENPEGSVYCLHCGKRLVSNRICPACKALCAENAVFCNFCGTQIAKETQAFFDNAEKRNVQEETAVASVQEKNETPLAPEKTEEQRSVFERVKAAFGLSSGICLMVAVFFSLVSSFCMGLTTVASVSSAEIGSVSETTSMWKYFGSAYQELSESFAVLEGVSSYYKAAAYMPVVLSTMICAGTILSVITFTIITAVKYGRHFKNPEIHYAQSALAAVLSFVIGATALLAVNSASVNLILDEFVRAKISFSDATTAGIVCCSVFLALYFACKVVTLGREITNKRMVVDLVCTLAGVLFIALVSAFAARPAVFFKINHSETSSYGRYGLGFNAMNMINATLFANTSPLPDKFEPAFVFCMLAQFAQIALLIVTIGELVDRIGKFGIWEERRLGISIELFCIAVVYLILSCLALNYGKALMTDYEAVSLSVSAAPIVAVIAAALSLADAITHKILLKKTSQND